MAAIIFLNAALFDGRPPGLLPKRRVAVEDGKITQVLERRLVIEAAGTGFGGPTLMRRLIDLLSRTSALWTEGARRFSVTMTGGVLRKRPL